MAKPSSTGVVREKQGRVNMILRGAMSRRLVARQPRGLIHTWLKEFIEKSAVRHEMFIDPGAL